MVSEPHSIRARGTGPRRLAVNSEIEVTIFTAKSDLHHSSHFAGYNIHLLMEETRFGNHSRFQVMIRRSLAIDREPSQRQRKPYRLKRNSLRLFISRCCCCVETKTSTRQRWLVGNYAVPAHSHLSVKIAQKIAIDSVASDRAESWER